MTHEVEEALKAEIEKRHLIEEPVLYGEDGVTAYSGFVFLSTRRRMPMMRENVEEYMKIVSNAIMSVIQTTLCLTASHTLPAIHSVQIFNRMESTR